MIILQFSSDDNELVKYAKIEFERSLEKIKKQLKSELEDFYSESRSEDYADKTGNFLSERMEFPEDGIYYVDSITDVLMKYSAETGVWVNTEKTFNNYVLTPDSEIYDELFCKLSFLKGSEEVIRKSIYNVTMDIFSPKEFEYVSNIDISTGKISALEYEDRDKGILNLLEEFFSKKRSLELHSVVRQNIFLTKSRNYVIITDKKTLKAIVGNGFASSFVTQNLIESTCKPRALLKKNSKSEKLKLLDNNSISKNLELLYNDSSKQTLTLLNNNSNNTELVSAEERLDSIGLELVADYLEPADYKNFMLRLKNIIFFGDMNTTKYEVDYIKGGCEYKKFNGMDMLIENNSLFVKISVNFKDINEWLKSFEFKYHEYSVHDREYYYIKTGSYHIISFNEDVLYYPISKDKRLVMPIYIKSEIPPDSDLHGGTYLSIDLSANSGLYMRNVWKLYVKKDKNTNKEYVEVSPYYDEISKQISKGELLLKVEIME